MKHYRLITNPFFHLTVSFMLGMIIMLLSVSKNSGVGLTDEFINNSAK